MNEWQNCYDLRWKKIIVKEAFSHPAKFSRSLILRIYDHVKEMRWIKPGDTVIDPFGGIALGAFYSGKFGLIWVGVELEEKFVKLGKENIKLWEAEDRAIIIQGDSRKLYKLLHPATIKLREDLVFDLCVSSPPFCISGNQPAGNMPSRPIRSKVKAMGLEKKSGEEYGQSPGQLGSMKEGSFDLCVSSPPYENSVSSKCNPQRDIERLQQKLKEGQICGRESVRIAKKGKHNPYTGTAFDQKYSESQNNLGNSSGDTFWIASSEIVQECYDILKPGGHAIWVCKDYVKGGQRIRFSDRWQKLCESVGFKQVCRHQAMQVKKYKGIIMEAKKESKGFFRRLAESKGSPPIDWEDIICMEKPEKIV